MSLEGTQGHFKYPYKLIIKWFVYVILFSCTVLWVEFYLWFIDKKAES